jgi:hypothetical protein
MPSKAAKNARLLLTMSLQNCTTAAANNAMSTSAEQTQRVHGPSFVDANSRRSCHEGTLSARLRASQPGNVEYTHTHRQARESEHSSIAHHPFACVLSLFAFTAFHLNVVERSTLIHVDIALSAIFARRNGIELAGYRRRTR